MNPSENYYRIGPLDFKESTEIEYTPSLVMAAVSESIKTLKTQAPLILVTGLCCFSEKPPCYYRQKYFRILDAQHERYSLQARISENLYDQLHESFLYTFEGILEKQIDISREGKLNIVFSIRGIRNSKEDDAVLNRNTEIYNEIISKQESGYIDVKNLLTQKLQNSQRPSIAVIVGTSSVAGNDLLSGLGDSKYYYKTSLYRVNITDPASIIKQLRSLSEGKPDVIVLARGGGDNLNTFNNPELLKAVNETKIPLITAIGHSTDKPYITEVADLNLDTPASCGNLLQQLARGLKAQKRKADLERSNRIAWIITYSLIALFLWFMFHR